MPLTISFRSLPTDPTDVKTAIQESLKLTETVGGIPINKKLSRYILKNEFKVTHEPYFLLRPGESPDVVVLDKVEGNIDDNSPEIKSERINILMKKGRLFVGKKMP